jgi:hypothetical protein
MKNGKLKRIKLSIWWNDKTSLEKVLSIIEPVLSVAIPVFWLFGNFYAQSDFLQIGTLIASFGLAALSAFYVYDNWHEQRGWAYFQLCKAVAWLFMSQLILLPAYK